MKIKDVLLIIAGIISAILIIFASIIYPVIEGVSNYGVPGFILKVIEFLVVFILVVGLVQYYNK